MMDTEPGERNRDVRSAREEGSQVPPEESHERSSDEGAIPPERRRRGRVGAARPATIEDVARRAGVSGATVSRALRSLPNVSDETRLRVEAAAAELDYHIDRTASRLATGRTETVGVVLPSIAPWYFSGVLHGIESVLGDRGFDLLVTSVHDSAARHRLASSSAPLRKRVDGLIFVDVLLTPDEVHGLSTSSMRVVTVGQATGVFDSVTIENREAVRNATRHLRNLGHRRIAFVAGEAPSGLPFSVPTERHDGYVEALVEAGLEPCPELVMATGIEIASGADAAAQLMAIADPPTAIVAASDDLAYGILHTLRNLGYSVPHDVSVVGFDDRDLSAAVDLTTVWHDPAEQGRLAADLFLEASDGPEERTHRDVLAGTRLVVRGTTAKAPA
jgi:DNA-binding LacI/PurR family transcriptional regulator